MTRSSSAIACAVLALSVAGAIMTSAQSARRQQQGQTARSWDERRIAVPLVGSVVAYMPHAPTDRVVLLVSGEGGWNAPLVALARHVAPKAIVIGISYPALKKSARAREGCWYVASDFEL